MENQRRLYLFKGETYILVPESSWRNEIKNDPFGITVQKSAEEPFFSKGWVKVSSKVDSNSHASETEWLHQETGTHMVVSVDRDGQLKVDGRAVGSTTSGDTFKALEKAVEEKGKWFTKASADGSPSRFFVPTEKVRRNDGIYPGMNARTPESITKIESSPMIALSQVIGKYDLPTLETATSKEDVVRNCNAMLELLAKESNPEKRKNLILSIDKQLSLAENMAKSDSLKAHVNELISSKDEPKASKEYAQMASQATDPKIKATLQGMSGDEARHAQNLKNIARRLD